MKEPEKERMDTIDLGEPTIEQKQKKLDEDREAGLLSVYHRSMTGRSWLAELHRRNYHDLPEEREATKHAYNELLKGNTEPVKALMTLPVKGQK